MTYEIKLPQFEGPFDLLLFFIERDELDIYDIPISQITDDFLNYLHQMKILNIEVASEFILVAATLMRIKAKMLLPRKDLDEFGQEIDPRQELVDRLLEYKKYKSVIDELKQMEDVRQNMNSRGNVMEEIKVISEKFSTEADLDTLNLYKLLQVFQKVIHRMEEKEEMQHQVIRYNFTIEDQKDILLKLISEQKKADFYHIFSHCNDKIHAIFTFLALLELVQQHILTIKLGLGLNNFWISAGEEYAREATTA